MSFVQIRGKKFPINATWVTLSGDSPENRITEIQELEGLDRLTNLEQLDLYSHHLKKIQGLHLPSIQKLCIADSQIKRIEGLDQLPNLKELNLFNNQIEKIEGLDRLPALQDLILVDNHITTIEGLDYLSNLRYLNLGNNQITTIGGLEHTHQLQILVLDHNAITTLNGLGSLPNLQELKVNNNQIITINGLEHVPNLLRLDLSSNKITQISGLEPVPNLRYLNLAENHITKVSGLGHLIKIEYLNLLVNSIPPITGLNFNNHRAVIRYCQEGEKGLAPILKNVKPPKKPKKWAKLGRHIKIENANPYGVLTPEALSQFEKDHDLQLPPDYRVFLLHYNGGTPVPACFTCSSDGEENAGEVEEFYGLHDNSPNSIDEWIGAEGIPQSMLPIGDDGCGNSICLGISSNNLGFVYFLDHEQHPFDEPNSMEGIFLIAKSFLAFLTHLIPNPEE